jgi:hypothetical protein
MRSFAARVMTMFAVIERNARIEVTTYKVLNGITTGV